MTMLAVQSLLLILAAFFAGAMAACFLRRVFFVRDNERPNPDGGRRTEQKSSTEKVVTTTVTNTTTTTGSPSEETSRFGRALTGVRPTGVSAVVSEADTEIAENASAVCYDADETFVYQDLTADVTLRPADTSHNPQPETPTGAPANDDEVGSLTKVPSIERDTKNLAAQAPDRNLDDLTLIRSISPNLAQRLYDAGVSNFSDIVSWHAPDVARFNRALGFVGRIEKENWIEQAAILSTGGITQFAGRQGDGKNPSEFNTWLSEGKVAQLSVGGVNTTPPKPLTNVVAATEVAQQQPKAENPHSADVSSANDLETSSAIPTSAPNSDVAALRSVRSEALVGTDAVRGDNVLTLPTATTGRSDDLKRVRGIGVLIEKRLNAMGIRTYQQIANWTAADVARVSTTLDFKGRIERESWIEQARILTSGGFTEFSRRSS